MNALYDVNFWVHTAVYLIGIGLLIAAPHARARGWMIGFLAVSLVTGAGYYATNVMMRTGMLKAEDYRRTFETWGAAMGAISVLGSLALLAYLIALKSPPPAAALPAASHGGSPAAPTEPAAPMTVERALFSFSGRMSRSDYWLKGFLVLLPIGIVNNVLFFSMGAREPVHTICIVISIASLWPSFALVTKRWHDRNRSAWWLALLLVPFVNIAGLVWILAEVWFLRGTAGLNRFGPDPLDVAPDGVAPLPQASGVA